MVWATPRKSSMSRNACVTIGPQSFRSIIRKSLYSALTLSRRRLSATIPRKLSMQSSRALSVSAERAREVGNSTTLPVDSRKCLSMHSFSDSSGVSIPLLIYGNLLQYFDSKARLNGFDVIIGINHVCTKIICGNGDYDKEASYVFPGLGTGSPFRSGLDDTRFGFRRHTK